MTASQGWYEDGSGADRLRYWDGAQWTNRFAPKPRATNNDERNSMLSRGGPGVPLDQVAHDLAMAYINNRYGVQVTGEMSIRSSTSSEIDAVNDVSGEGEVTTQKLPGLFELEMTRVGTGQRSFLGMGPEKTQLVPTGKYEVDSTLRGMIDDYYSAYARFRELLERR